LFTDGSFQRYLSDDYPFTDPQYTPADLQKIISYFTYNQSSKFMLRAPAATAFADMARAFWDNFDKKRKLYIVSAYRSYTHQKSIKAN
jgi:LAS superfamily LD-carboxypeptidase LdcB